MILAKDFVNSKYSRQSEFQTNDKDQPLIVQFASDNVHDFVNASKLVSPYAQGVDLNCGCPQKWAIQEGIGSAMLNKPDLIKEIIRNTRAEVDLSCSIKIRLMPNIKDTIELVKRAENIGVDFVTIHGRTRFQRSSEKVDWESIKLIKDLSHIPIVANGDINSVIEADEMFSFSKVDGFMAARGLLANPAMFSEYKYTPWEAIEKFIDLSLNYGTHVFVFHHHLMMMLDNVMSVSEKKTFNSLNSIPAILDYLTLYT